MILSTVLVNFAQRFKRWRLVLGVFRGLFNLRRDLPGTRLVNRMTGALDLNNVAAGALFCGHAKNVREAQAVAHEHLAFTGLADMADRPAASLTLARRKRLELAKSLAMRPRLLMLDEVNAGLNPTEIEEALGIIRRIAEQGVTIIVIEHLMKVVLSISQRVAVLHHGQLIALGAPRDVIRNESVIEAYLGAKYAAANRHEVH